jgi:hypothetical protein
VPGPFGQPQPVDLSLDLASGYQKDASNKIAQAKVQQRKTYTAGYVGKYGVKDAAAATKGLSDTDVYGMAAKLVNNRRGTTAPASTPVAPAPPKVTPKPPAKRAPAKKVSSTKRPTKPSTKRRPTAKRPAPKAPAKTPTKVTIAPVRHVGGAQEY